MGAGVKKGDLFYTVTLFYTGTPGVDDEVWV